MDDRPIPASARDADADISRTTDGTTMQPSASDAPLSVPSDHPETAASADPQQTEHVAHVRCVDGDDHLKLQLQICNDRKTFFRAVSEKLDKLRHRLQILASQAVDGAAAEFHGNRTRKQRNKIDQLHAHSTKVRVRFFTATNEEIVGKSVQVGDALMRTEQIAIGDTTYVVLRNQPTVLSVYVVSPVLAGIPVMPLPETDFCSPDECAWRWHRIDPETGNESFVCDSRRYVPTQDDVGSCFRIECHAPLMDSRFAHESRAEVVTTPVVNGPDRSVFKARQKLGATRAGCGDVDAFRVMTYNVLFEGYTSSLQAKTEIFPYAKHEVMEEMYRMQLVFQEIQESNADVVCAQEMGQNAFHTFFAPMLKPLGYHAVYTGKTGTTHEGCAVFIRTDRFEVVEERVLAVSEEALRCDDDSVVALLEAYPELRKGLEKIPSIAQLLVLRDKRQHPQRHVLLANTHLFYREDADMIRVVQAIATVRVIEKFHAELADSDATQDVSVVLCGDFNAVPDSATVHFLLNGAVDASHRHWQELRDFRWVRNGRGSSNGPKPPCSDRSSGRIAHSLALDSACGIPEFTNFAGSFVATLDYILLGSRALEVIRPFPLFTREEVSAEVALPATAFPSDHISLIADLRWRGHNILSPTFRA